MSITSEVSFGLTKVPTKNEDFIVTNFRFSDNTETKSGEVIYDEDGDLIRDFKEEHTIKIRHKIQTDLSNVGFQVWRGSLYLADFALENAKLFENQRVLEIGAGTGLTSIVVSNYCNASEVCATDLKDFTDLIEDNVKFNNSSASVKLLDLFNFSDFSGDYDIILGADVIYDNDITEAVINFMNFVVKKASKDLQFLFSIDKRYIFTLDDLETVAPAYEFFVAKFADLEFDFDLEEISNVPQHFCYERSNSFQKSSDLIILSLKSKIKR